MLVQQSLFKYPSYIILLGELCLRLSDANKLGSDLHHYSKYCHKDSYDRDKIKRARTYLTTTGMKGKIPKFPLKKKKANWILEDAEPVFLTVHCGI